MWDTYSAVSLPGCSSLPGEEDEFGAVHLQPLDVGVQGLCGSVAAAWVYSDADGAGHFLIDTSSLRHKEDHEGDREVTTVSHEKRS